MKQMNGLDRMFINIESDRLPMDMFAILTLDPSTAPGGHDYDRVRAEVSARVTRNPVFTRRLVAAPFGAGHEHWAVDPDFSIDRHLNHIGAPAPHDLSALCELAVDLADEPLSRDRPLWQMYYVDGLADGSAALLVRLHHAAIDAVGGMDILTEILDSEPLPADPALTPATVEGERVPTGSEMLLRSLPDQLTAPIRFAYRGVPLAIPLARGLLRRVAKTASGPSSTDDAAQAKGAVPRSLLNRYTDNSRRSLALTSIPMADITTAKERFGVTVNDVVLSITSAAVADYLRDRDELPDEPMRVVAPVNIRDDDSGSGNHFAFMMVAIPSDIADPVERLKAIAALTEQSKPERTAKDDTAKRKPTGTMVGPLMRLIDALPGGLWLALGRLTSMSTVIEALPTLTNYAVSNIPGPPEKLYVAGAEVTHLYGRGMVGAGVGLLVHCLSYRGNLDFGFTTLSDLVPDPDKIADGVQRHFAALLKAATKTGSARSAKRKTSTRRPAKKAGS